MPRYSYKRAVAAPASSIQFGASVSDRKATAAKSAGTVGKWGVTSFTSIRSSIVNGSGQEGDEPATPARPPSQGDPFSFQSSTPGAAAGVPKVKKFFKSRNPPAVVAAAASVAEQRKQQQQQQQHAADDDDTQNRRRHSEEKVAADVANKRFFSSPAATLPLRDSVTLPLRDSTTTRANSLSPRHPPPPAQPQPPKHPPLRLRISRDKDTGDLMVGSGILEDDSVPAAALAATAAVTPPATPAIGAVAPLRVGRTLAAPVRRKRPPPTIKPPKAARFDPPVISPPTDPPVRRSRRAAAAEARDRVAKTVQSGSEEEEEEVEEKELVRPRRGGRRRGSALSEQQPTPLHESPVSEGMPTFTPALASTRLDSDGQQQQQQTSQVPGSPGESPPHLSPAVSPQHVSDEDGPGPPTATEPAASPPVSTASDSPAHPEVPVPAQPEVPVPAQHEVPVPAQHEVPVPAEPEVPIPAQPEVPVPAQPEVPVPVQPEVPVPAQPEVPESAQQQTLVQQEGRLPAITEEEGERAATSPPRTQQAGTTEPVNLSTRQSASDLERQLSSLFGEPMTSSAAAPVSSSPLKPPLPHLPDSPEKSRVYRKGIKDLGRYQRTQVESVAVSTPSSAAASVSGDSSPRRFTDIESQLELLESGWSAPAAPAATPAAAPAAAAAVAPVEALTQEVWQQAGRSQTLQEETPPLTRAATEPVELTTSVRSRTRASTAAAAAAAAAASKPPPADPPRKGSIFKSRSGQGRAARARYNHRWTADDEAASVPVPAHNNGAAAAALGFSADDEASPIPRLTRVSTWHGSDPNETGEHVTSVKIDRRAKEYYTVIRNVKKAYQVQELGEFQEYNDDIEYIMDALQPTNSVSTRCLSTTRLAGKCTVAAFRMHLRAHGTVTRFFAALSDAPADPSLSLCTAAVMFILSEDQLNMDLDKRSLELMLSLLDSDTAAAPHDSGELGKNAAKVRELILQLQRNGQAKQLNLDCITAANLAMETLLSLTSQRAGAWFKEELRELGGLDRLMSTLSESVRSLRQAGEVTHQQDTVARVSRCLRVVENVTSRNEENQRYVLQREGSLETLSVLQQLAVTALSDAEMREMEGSGRALLDMTETLMKVLVNLSHERIVGTNPAASKTCGAQLLGQQPGLLHCQLQLLLRTAEQLPQQRQFDMLLLSMMLLMNLAEGSADNRRWLLRAEPPSLTSSAALPRRAAGSGSAVSELLNMFQRMVALADDVESRTDRLLDGSAPAVAAGTQTTQQTQQDANEITAAALIQGAGHHMENTVIAAYIGVLVGHLAMDNPEYEAVVRSQLPGGRYADMVEVLKKLLNFMNLVNTGRPETAHEMNTMLRVMNFMSAADTPPVTSQQLSQQQQQQQPSQQQQQWPSPEPDDMLAALDMSL